MPDTSKKIRVYLSSEQRATLEAICRSHSVGAAKQRRARILLMADENHAEGGFSDRQIAERVDLCERQVVRLRQRYVREGDKTLDRSPRPPVLGKLDGKAEAHLVTLCCSKPPEGRDHWTLQLLCDELARLEVVESVCRETVRKSLKKTNLSLGGRSGFAFPKRIEHGSLRGWKKSSMCIRKRTTRSTH
jgi:transposase